MDRRPAATRIGDGLLETVRLSEGGVMHDATAGRDDRVSVHTLGLIDAALGAEDAEGLATATLPRLCTFAGSPTGMIFLSDPRFSQDGYADCGREEAASGLEVACGAWLDRILDGEGCEGTVVSSDRTGERFALHPLAADGRTLGFVGISDDVSVPEGAAWSRLVGTVARLADRLADRASTERKLLHLNTYLTVSSMLAKPVDLSELLEIALFCSMEAVSAEASSILLLDESKENFEFHHVAGPAKPLLGKTTFPATEGVAGRVLRTLEAEIVNEEDAESRVYRAIDDETGFRTRNMIAVPLIAGEEHIGVLEVLNKADGGPFTVDERLILVSVAEEIAFAIRNATLFDYVVNTYCKRRQGQNSCKGCERPLGSWTPCMRYREFLP